MDRVIKEKIEEKELLLSEAYTKKTKDLNLELRVKIWNINLGNSEEIYRKSRTMREYMIFVDKARRYSEGQPLDEAIERTGGMYSGKCAQRFSVGK